MRFFDLHCDTLYEIVTQNKDIYQNDLDVSLVKSSDYRPYIGCFAVWIPDELRGTDAFSFFERCSKELYNLEARYVRHFKVCKTVVDLEEVSKSGKSGVVLTIEGSAALAGKISNVELMSRLGVKIITLTWNGSCEAGDGIGVINSRGLTNFGKNLLTEMEKHGIIVDISHASERLFYDVCSLASKPFIATHSNARNVCENKRNISDDQFKHIRDIGGLVGITMCSSFLSNTQKSGFDSFLRHMEHFLSLSGENTLCIGSDFDGAEMTTEIKGLESIQNLYEYLLTKNYSETLLDKIFFNNAYNFMNKFF